MTHVRLSEVVAEAGMTTGAAYRCWDDQTAFRRDLALAAVRHRDRGTILITIPLRMTSPSDPELARASGERHREAMTSLSGEPHPRVHRDDVGPQVGADWTLFGLALEAIVEEFTEPIDVSAQDVAIETTRNA